MIDKKAIRHLRRLVKIWCKQKAIATRFVKEDIETFIKLEKN